MSSGSLAQSPSKKKLREWSASFESAFRDVSTALFSELKPSEALSLSLDAESSQFIRFNNARVRQIGTVDDGTLRMRYFADGRQMAFSLPFEASAKTDISRFKEALARARKETPEQPLDPSIVWPSASEKSHSVTEGSLLDHEDAARTLLAPAGTLDMCGLFASGPIARGLADSAGQFHWFATETFFVDYSLWHTSGKAVKSGYAGERWSDAEWLTSLADARAQLAALDRPMRTIAPGEYRVFLEASALGEILGMFSWLGLSERALRQKESAFLLLRDGREKLSPLFTLSEDFTSGRVPRFTGEGDLAPQQLTLVRNGLLENTLVSSRTGKEYGIEHNGAGAWESLRSPEVAGGTLATADRVKALGTGLYLPNLHYLNWSDIQNARITGMTRYAALWVEDGAYVGPIQDLRFDDTLYNVLGSRLEALTVERSFIPETGTYGSRNLGGALLPGALIGGFKFTL